MNGQAFELVDSKHPIHKVLHDDVKRGITACIDVGANMSAVKLIYAGIDLMAYLCMPKKTGKGPNRVHKKDFVKWVDTYMEFDKFLNISGDEIHQARHAAVHRHSLENKPGARHFVPIDGPIDIAFPVPAKMTGVECVFISIRKFADTFFRAIDNCLIDIHRDRNRLELMEKRFNDVAQTQAMSHEQMLKLVDGLMEHYRPH